MRTKYFFCPRFPNFLSNKISDGDSDDESENSDFNDSDDDDDSNSDDDDDVTDEEDAIHTAQQPKFEPLDKERKSSIASGD